MYNFISNKNIINLFKRSKYFKVDLGKSFSSEKNGRRNIDLETIGDSFVKQYLKKYRSIVYREGKIGSINFFTDHHINNDIIIVFDGEEDYVFQHNQTLYKNKGVDSYIGSFIENIETQNNNNEKENSEKRGPINADKKEGNADKIFKDPGNVTYEDIKKYYSKKLSK